MRIYIAVDVDTDDEAKAVSVAREVMRYGFNDLDEEDFGIVTNGVEVEVVL